MPLSMPQELEVWYVIPAVRRELALRLKKRGLTQKQIAQKLFVTEPAISQYLHSKRAKKVLFNEKIHEQLDEVSEKLLKASSKVDVIKQIQRVCIEARKSLVLCTLHKQLEEDFECRGCDCYEK